MRLERDLWLTLGAAVGLIALFGCTLFLPQHLKQQRLTQQLAEAEMELDQNRQGTAGMDKLQADVDRLRKALAEAPKTVPAETDIAPLLRQLSSDLEVLQVSDKEVVTQPVVDGTNFGLVPMTLKFTGSYRTLYEFLQRLEGNPRLIRVIRLELDGSVEQLGQPVQARVDLMTFFSPSQAAVASARQE